MKVISNQDITESAFPVNEARLPIIKISRLRVDQAFPLLSLASTTACVLLGLLALTRNNLEPFTQPVLAGLCLMMQVLFLEVYRQYRRWDFQLIFISVLAFIFILVLQRTPLYLTGWQLNAIIHRSVFSAIFLIAVGLPGMSKSIYYLLGARPRAEDFAHYPIILFPVVLALFLYLGLIWQLVLKGAAIFDLSGLTSHYASYGLPVKYYIAGDWPAWKSTLIETVGIKNHLLGTGFLMLLTSLISLPIGVGAGIYLSEYGDSWFSSTARFLISSLRAISLLILGLTAYSLAHIADFSSYAWIFQGLRFTGWEYLPSGGGSYLAVSLVLSLLIIPVITRMTEEGCQSLPPELREGSYALGASEEMTLRRIVLPWALPNIITGLLLGCAEAAGSVAVLMFVAGRGDFGVGFDKQATSLAYLVFDINFGDQAFRGLMQRFQFQAAFILLVITLGLGITSMLVKHWLMRHYRGL